MDDYWRKEQCPVCKGEKKLVCAIVDDPPTPIDFDPDDIPKTVPYHTEIKDCWRCNGAGYFMISRYVPLSDLPEDLR